MSRTTLNRQISAEIKKEFGVNLKEFRHYYANLPKLDIAQFVTVMPKRGGRNDE